MGVLGLHEAVDEVNVVQVMQEDIGTRVLLLLLLVTLVLLLLLSTKLRLQSLLLLVQSLSLQLSKALLTLLLVGIEGGIGVVARTRLPRGVLIDVVFILTRGVVGLACTTGVVAVGIGVRRLEVV